MTIAVWRIVPAARASETFSGEGACLYGGRWNHPGTPIVYTPASLALAALETLVHATLSDLLASFVCVRAEFDDSLLQTLDPSLLKSGWDAYPAHKQTMDIGARWARRMDSAVLAVPSVVIPRESNYLLNPLHPDYPRIRIGEAEELRIDPRLVRLI
ncbi:MAG: RES family NAD+ phosphorylase [Candidatus Sumerlaeota bacterium]|nr:RES family NAD+ phosphorylase [Candidatus Sumerlaeota bacterium]